MSKKTPAPALSASVLSAPFTVPLSALILVEGQNVRDGATISDAGIAQMAAMLEATGQLSPLIVSKRDDQYVVHAGQRRTRGFLMLLEKAKIAPDHPVEVREIDPALGIDVSLIENLSQEPMHPVDEFKGFKRLADKGYSPAHIAKTYGCKLLTVQRRLKLADVHPDLLVEFRKGEMEMGQVMALASCDDQERQLMIWKSLPDYSRNDQQIRRRIAQDQISVDDARVKVVGLDVYLAAGGTVHADLFSEKGDAQFLSDAGLLEMLLADKLEALAEQTRAEGWAWVEVLPAFGYEERQNFPDYPVIHLPESTDQASRRETLENEIEALEDANSALYEKDEQSDEDEATISANDQKIKALEFQVAAIRAERVDPSGVDMLIAGALVFVSDDQIVVKKPVVKQADAKALSKGQARSTGATPGGVCAGAPGDGDAAPVEAVSERLMMNLTAQRTAALQALMIENQKVTLAALACSMATREFGKSVWFDGPLKVSLTSQWHTLRDASPTFNTSPAHALLIEKHDAWVALLPPDASEYLSWFIDQPLEVSLSMITFCTALTTNALRGRPDSVDNAANLAAALNLDMADWWTPTPDNYLGLVPKAKMMEAVVQAKGDSAAQGMDKMKKAEAIAHAAAALDGSRWLPSVLR